MKWNKTISVVLLVFMSSCVHSNGYTSNSIVPIKNEGVLLSERIETNSELVEKSKHKRVLAKIHHYTKDPSIFSHFDEERILILNYILEEVDKREMPYAVAMIPLVESSYRPNASNKGTHVGLWQLGAPTARSFGADVNRQFDGRYNIEQSTKAALNYLEYLNKMFKGDWLLTMAAYNAGEGRVLRSIKRNKRLGKPTDYWSLSLPKITEDYIPKVLALSELSREDKRLQRDIDELPRLIRYRVKSRTDLMAKLNKGNTERLVDFYNPNKSISRNNGYTVVIPEHLIAKKPS